MKICSISRLKLNFLFCIIFSFFPSLTAGQYSNLLAVMIMVKNEAEVIIPTLQPFIDAGIDSFFVYDTGSTDGTQKIISDHFKECDIKNFFIIEEPFVDFATSRNKALDLVEKLFPQTTFFLMLDAEWYAHNVQELIQFCQDNKDYIAPETNGGCYLIRLRIEDNIDNFASRLFRREKNVRYAGSVHESVTQQPSGIVPHSVFFYYWPNQSGKRKSKERFLRDYVLLKAEYEKDPTHSRTLFYLAQTCQFLEEWEEAIFYYQKRAALGELSEEKFLALYRIACAIDHLMANKYKDDQDRHLILWQDALYYYLLAHEMLPHRVEPLVRIAYHYLKSGQYALAYIFAKRSVELPYPKHDLLFVERKLYDCVRYDILGQCALYLGEIEIGKNAVLKAIKASPQTPHLYHNLDTYLQFTDL